MKDSIAIWFVGAIIFMIILLGVILSIPSMNYGYLYGRCTIEKTDFKFHKIQHFHKSKKYIYNHHNPCECLYYGDLYNENYKQDPRDNILK